MRAVITGILVVASAAGCVFNAGVDERVQIRCASTSECPPSFVCASGSCSPGVDRVAPTLVDASFAPSVARAGSHVELAITADEALGSAPVLTFAAGAPPFALVGAVDGARAVFAADMSRDGGDSVVTLTSVALTDAAGNRDDVDVEVVLAVDRTAPVVSGLVADRAVYSRVAPFDVVTATFDTDESLDDAPASVAAFIGDVALACGAYAAASPRYTCVTPAGAVLPAGDQAVLAIGVDSAGNIANAGLPVVVDVTPPVVAPGSVAVVITGGAAAFAPTLAVGTTATVTFDADEPLGATATAQALGPATLDFAAIVNGAHVTATYTVSGALALGTYSFVATLTDVVGNTGVVDVALPIPGLVAAQDVASPCVARFATGDAVCTDFDGDGRDGVTSACPGGDDCNDDDAFVHPGALDVPGDFTDNGCAETQGAPVDDSSGIFVASDAGEHGDGTRANPVASIARAFALLDLRRAIFVKGGTYPVGDGVLSLDGPVFIVGGFDASWNRTHAATKIVATCTTGADGLQVGGDFVLDDIEVATSTCENVVEADGLYMRRAALTGTCPSDSCYVATDTLLATQSTLTSVHVNSSACTLLDSTATDSSFGSGSVSLVRTRAVDSIASCADVSLVSTSWIGGVIEADEDVGIFQSTVTGIDAINIGLTTPIRLFNSIVISDSALFSSDETAPMIEIDNCDIVAACVSPSCNGSVIDGGFDGELGHTENVDVDPLFDVDGIHLLPSSSLLGLGSSNLIDRGEPTSAASDIDGACRDTSNAPDIGADER